MFSTPSMNLLSLCTLSRREGEPTPRGAEEDTLQAVRARLGLTLRQHKRLLPWLRAPRYAGEPGVVARSEDGLTTLSETTLAAPDVVLRINATAKVVGAVADGREHRLNVGHRDRLR